MHVSLFWHYLKEQGVNPFGLPGQPLGLIHKTRKKGTKVKRLLLLTDIYEKDVFSVSKTGASVEKIQDFQQDSNLWPSEY